MIGAKINLLGIRVGLLVEQGQQQTTSIFSGLVHRRAAENPATDQARVPEDAQVAADAGLLAFSDQAEIANARLSSVSQYRQQRQPDRIAESLSLAAEALCFLQLHLPLAQSLSFPRARDLQSAWGISHGR